MKRRTFIQSAMGAGTAIAVPSSLTLSSLINPAFAAPAYSELDFAAPAVLPQVINIFLYGGASELAGNLTNVVDIDANSQNPYPDTLVDRNNGAPGNGVTRNGFWAAAGGNDMEFMLEQGYMSIYRTVMKRKNTSRSHRENIFMGQKGSLDIEGTPGIGTRLAYMLYSQRSAIQSTTVLADGSPIASVENMLFPFISFEGETTLFASDPSNPLPLRMRGLTLDEDFDNPYTRAGGNNGDALDALVSKVQARYSNSRFQQAINGFDLRQQLEERIGNLSAAADGELPVIDQVVDQGNNFNANNNRLVYPNNGFANRVRAAVTLAIENPATAFIAVGTDGLGGWDDHNNGFDRYPVRMAQLMDTMDAAMKHIKYSGTQTANVVSTPGTAGSGSPLVRTTDNIVINIYGDFGRLVNRNNSNGWDHANNQNLYTFGGAAVQGRFGPRQLGKIVGTTVRGGNSGQNNQFTLPTSESYEIEPLAIASTTYTYFGAQNPHVLTKDEAMNPLGDEAINENIGSVPIVPAPPPA